jgi:2-oxoglutarate dehydrogenase complex dehydrogenase (E1) component-like enzyme
MTIDQTLSMLVTVGLALAGWWISYFTTLRRDRAQKKRDLKVQYLIEAYRRLENAAHRNPLSRENKNEMESAMADIQLFGSQEQVELVVRYAQEFANQGSAGLDDLLKSLRRDLRKELDLGEVGPEMAILRMAP